MRRFFDTNVLVYSWDFGNSTKHEIARGLVEEAIAQHEFVLSTQVMLEFYATCTRRKLLGASQALALIRLWSEHDTVPQTPDLVVRGLELHQEHSLSLWDGLIVQAALDAKCDLLLSEDLQHGRRFGALEVVNPFGVAAQEPRSSYKRSKAKGRARA